MQQNKDLRRLMQLAQSETGQQLLALLKTNGGQGLENALSQASAGEDTQLRQALASLLQDPQVQSLIRQLEGQL